jgi:hypothetical protein
VIFFGARSSRDFNKRNRPVKIALDNPESAFEYLICKADATGRGKD